MSQCRTYQERVPLSQNETKYCEDVIVVGETVSNWWRRSGKSKFSTADHWPATGQLTRVNVHVKCSRVVLSSRGVTNRNLKSIQIRPPSHERHSHDVSWVEGVQVGWTRCAVLARFLLVWRVSLLMGYVLYSFSPVSWILLRGYIYSVS